MCCMGGGGQHTRHHIINTRSCFSSPPCVAALLKVRESNIKFYYHHAQYDMAKNTRSVVLVLYTRYCNLSKKSKR